MVRGHLDTYAIIYIHDGVHAHEGSSVNTGNCGEYNIQHEQGISSNNNPLTVHGCSTTRKMLNVVEEPTAPTTAQIECQLSMRTRYKATAKNDVVQQTT